MGRHRREERESGADKWALLQALLLLHVAMSEEKQEGGERKERGKKLEEQKWLLPIILAYKVMNRMFSGCRSDGQNTYKGVKV